MELFIDGLGAAALADRLRTAIGGRGAFRRFKDVLGRDECSSRRCHRFCDERQRGRARARARSAEEGCCPRLPVQRLRPGQEREKAARVPLRPNGEPRRAHLCARPGAWRRSQPTIVCASRDLPRPPESQFQVASSDGSVTDCQTWVSQWEAW